MDDLIYTNGLRFHVCINVYIPFGCNVVLKMCRKAGYKVDVEISSSDNQEQLFLKVPGKAGHTKKTSLVESIIQLRRQ